MSKTLLKLSGNSLTVFWFSNEGCSNYLFSKLDSNKTWLLWIWVNINTWSGFIIVNLIYITLLKACKNTFPCPNRDLRAQYLRALEVERKKNNNNLPAASNANSAQDKDNNTWLLDFRRSLHSQLSHNVKHKQGHLYRYLFSFFCLSFFLFYFYLV